MRRRAGPPLREQIAPCAIERSPLVMGNGPFGNQQPPVALRTEHLRSAGLEKHARAVSHSRRHGKARETTPASLALIGPAPPERKAGHRQGQPERKRARSEKRIARLDSEERPTELDPSEQEYGERKGCFRGPECAVSKAAAAPGEREQRRGQHEAEPCRDQRLDRTGDDGFERRDGHPGAACATAGPRNQVAKLGLSGRSEEHTSELQSRQYLVCRLLLEK